MSSRFSRSTTLLDLFRTCPIKKALPNSYEAPVRQGKHVAHRTPLGVSVTPDRGGDPGLVSSRSQGCVSLRQTAIGGHSPGTPGPSRHGPNGLQPQKPISALMPSQSSEGLSRAALPLAAGSGEGQETHDPDL